MAENTTLTDDRRLDAELRKLAAEADKAEWDARRSLIDSLVPTLPTELPRGSITSATEEPSPIGAIATYHALHTAAKAISEATSDIDLGLVWIAPENPLPHGWFVYNQLLDQTHRSREAMQAATERLAVRPPSADELFRRLASVPPMTTVDGEGPGGTLSDGAPHHGLHRADKEDAARSPAPAAATAAAQFAFSALPLVLSAFETTTSVSSGSMTVGFMPAAAALAEALRSRASDVVVSGISSRHAAGMASRVAHVQHDRELLVARLAEYRRARAGDLPRVAAESERMTMLKSVIDAALKGDAGLSAERLAIVRQMIAEVESAAQNVASFRQSRAADQVTVDGVIELLKSVDSVLLPLTATAEGVKLINEAAAYEQFQTADIAHVLVLEVSFAGRRTELSERLGPNDRELHVGSLVVTWFLLDRDGSVVAGSVTPVEQAATGRAGSAELQWAEGRQLQPT